MKINPIQATDFYKYGHNLLRTVFKDGVLTIDESIDTIRARLQKEL